MRDYKSIERRSPDALIHTFTWTFHCTSELGVNVALHSMNGPKLWYRALKLRGVGVLKVELREVWTISTNVFKLEQYQKI